MSSVWLGKDLRMDTKKTFAERRDWFTCANFVDHSQHWEKYGWLLIEKKSNLHFLLRRRYSWEFKNHEENEGRFTDKPRVVTM